MHPEQGADRAETSGLHGDLAPVGPAQCGGFRERDVLAGADAGEIPVEVLIPAGDDVLAVVGHIARAIAAGLGAHGVGAAAEAATPLQQGHRAPGLGQPDRRGQPGQPAADDHEAPRVVSHPATVTYIL